MVGYGNIKLTKHAPKFLKLEKPITNYGFLYNIFTNKPYARTPFNIFIIDYQFLTSYYVMFNPTCLKPNLLMPAGIRFHIPVFIYIYFVKIVKPKSSSIHS